MVGLGRVEGELGELEVVHIDRAVRVSVAAVDKLVARLRSA